MNKFKNFISKNQEVLIVSGVILVASASTITLAILANRWVNQGLEAELDAALDVIKDLGGNAGMVDDKIMSNISEIIQS